MDFSAQTHIPTVACRYMFSFLQNDFISCIVINIVDRSRNGGGVMIYIRDEIPSKKLDYHNLPNDIKSIFVELYYCILFSQQLLLQQLSVASDPCQSAHSVNSLKN